MAEVLFSIGDKVRIDKLALEGEVIGMMCSIYFAVQYQVEFVSFGREISMKWFYGSQLSKIKKPAGKENILDINIKKKGK